MSTYAPYFAVILAIVFSVACKDDSSQGPIPIEDLPDATLQALPGPKPVSSDRLRWPDEFDDWYGEEIDDGARLPECPGGWFDRPIDDEFVLWKCPSYKGLSIKDVGQLSVHVDKGKVFMVTTSADFDDPLELEKRKEELSKTNADRELKIPKEYKKFITRFWDLKDYVVVLSAGKRGLSLLYLRSEGDIDEVFELLRRQTKLARLDRRYTLANLQYKLKTVETEDFVGRGRERWDSKKDSDFVLVKYEVRNLSRTVLQDDPATFTLIGRGVQYEPDARAEHALFTSDRTGHLVTPLDYRATRQRTRIFEVKKEISSSPMILVVNNAGQKAVFELDLSNRQTPP